MRPQPWVWRWNGRAFYIAPHELGGWQISEGHVWLPGVYRTRRDVREAVRAYCRGESLIRTA